MFDDFLDRNLTFSDNKKTDLKKLQNLHFSKGVSPWVFSKIGGFSIFLFYPKMTGKCVLRYFREKKTPL